MSIIHTLPARLQSAAHRHLLGAVRRAERRSARWAERGDVPGWVLITLMTAGIVTALWVVAKGQLVDMFQSALASVNG